LRLNTPRSSASITSTNTLNKTQNKRLLGIVAIVKDASVQADERAFSALPPHEMQF
jgi:hypothetical protein